MYVGMLMGHVSTKEQRSEFAEKIKADPRNYIAQPVVTLSTCPTWTDEGTAPRHVDLRPYIVSGTSSWVLPPDNRGPGVCRDNFRRLAPPD